MRLTILDQQASLVIGRIGVAVLAGLPLAVMPALGDPFQAARLLPASLGLLAVVAFSQTGFAKSRETTVALWLVLGVAALALVSSFANHPASSLWGTMGRMQGLLTGGLLVAAGAAGAWAPRGWALPFVRVLSGVLGIETVIVLSQALSGGMPDGTFGNRGIAGAWIAVATCITAAAVVARRDRFRLLLGIAASAGVLALGATGTRGAWVGLIAAAVAGVLGLPKRPLRFVPIAAGIAAGGVALVVLGSMLAGPSAAEKLDPRALLTGSAASRIEIWSGSIGLIATEPILGVGPGRFLYEFPAFQSVRQARHEGLDVRADQAHNLFMQIAAESGLPASLGLIVISVLALMTSARAARAGRGTAYISLVGLSAYLGQAMFGVAGIETDVLGWFLVGTALASVHPAVSGKGDRGARVGSLRLASALLLICIISLSSVYMIANARYARGLAYFRSGDFKNAISLADSASRLDPFTDVYRVAQADAAAYSGTRELQQALTVLDRGLSLEPDSYDLRLARARTLRRLAAPPAEIADAYGQAVAAFPVGTSALAEAAAAAENAGDAGRAAAYRVRLAELTGEQEPTEAVVR